MMSYVNATSKHCHSCDVLVAIDACFTQKRRKGARDPPRIHPDTTFLTEEEVIEMEQMVNTTQNSQQQ